MTAAQLLEHGTVFAFSDGGFISRYFRDGIVAAGWYAFNANGDVLTMDGDWSSDPDRQWRRFDTRNEALAALGIEIDE